MVEDIQEGTKGNITIKEKQDKRKAIRLWTLIIALGIVFATWVITEYVISFNCFDNKESLQEFSKIIPFFLTTILGVIIGTSID